VLGQIFLDDPDQVRSVRAGVPPWFSNLLPEGLLRSLIAKQAGVAETREFFLLRHLGEDLPGAAARPHRDRQPVGGERRRDRPTGPHRQSLFRLKFGDAARTFNKWPASLVE
jgi:hypothetical protein